MVEIRNFRDEAGREPFQDWFDTLDRQAAAKVATTLRRMEQGNFGDVKSVGDGVVERRVDWGPGYRIYFARDGDVLVILLGGETKQRQQRDIELAQSRWSVYRRQRK